MSEKRYCPFCRTHRSLPSRRHIGLKQVFGLAVLGLALMWAIWQEFDARVIPVIAFFWGLAEVIIQFRWSLSITCPECGFDPRVYLRSPEEAAQKVKRRLEARRHDPATLLKPPLQLPKPPANPELKGPGSKHKGLLSRQA